tara:strand:+ start:278 stop:508 length:231 start_codon:yes stop_codon:yes gene_type:complete
VIDMIGFTQKHADRIRELGLNISTIVERITEENKNLQELTKEYLGESYSEEIINKIIQEELHKELMDKIEVILFDK